MRDRVSRFAVLGCAVLLGISAAAQKQSVIASSDDDEITLTQPTEVGNLTLQPDTYVVQHHTSHRKDFVRFMQVKTSQKLRLTRAYTGWYTDTELIKAGETECRIQPLSTKAQATTATVETAGGKSRIIKIMIKGKAVLYAF
jgi:hypothetical protein